LTIFTAAALVQMAADDPSDIVGITTGESEYWFFDQGGAGYFSWDNGATAATPPASGWFAVTLDQLDSFVFVQADPVSDFIAVTDENPANSGFLYFPMVLGPASVPPAPGPTIGIVATDASKNEGNSGSTPFTFTLTRSGITNGTNSVTWTVSGGQGPSANAADFVGGTFPTGIVTFGPNETTKVITVNVQGDTVFEPNENFVVSLSNPTNGATIDPAHPNAQGLIVNDDAPPPSVLSIAAVSASKAEGNSGATPFTFTVTRSGGTTGTSTADWSVGPATSGGSFSQANGSDFVGGGFPTGTVTFAPGQTSQTVTVNVQGDTLYEPNENFVVKLSNPVSATIDPNGGSASGVILNDDTAPTGAVVFISPLNAVRAEGPVSTLDFTFTVTRLVPAAIGAATVNWQVTAGANDPIDAAQFFGGTFPSGSITFASDQFPIAPVGFGVGIQSQVITIPVQGGIDFQSGGVPEQFIVTLSGSSTRGAGYTIDSQDGSASGSILDYAQPPAINDFNGDGKSDIFWRDPTSGTDVAWMMNGSTVTGMQTLYNVPAGFSVAGMGDFTGDGATDILWRNPTTGADQVWLMGGGNITASAPINSLPSAWTVADIADFNGDGDDDILLRNSSNGANFIWTMNGDQISGGNEIYNVPTSWAIAGVGKFFGGTQTDILLRQASTGTNFIWQMNGTNVVGGSLLDNADASWSIAGLGDFNGDGTTDVLMRQASSGTNLIWTIQNGAVAGSTVLPNAPSDWSVAAVADFNHDGTEDVLMRNATTGTNLLWTMQNGQVSQSTVLNNLPANWSVAEIGDFNGDGTPDVLWHDSTGGANLVWTMSSSGSIMSSLAINTVPTSFAAVNNGHLTG